MNATTAVIIVIAGTAAAYHVKKDWMNENPGKSIGMIVASIMPMGLLP